MLIIIPLRHFLCYAPLRPCAPASLRCAPSIAPAMHPFDHPCDAPLRCNSPVANKMSSFVIFVMCLWAACVDAFATPSLDKVPQFHAPRASCAGLHEARTLWGRGDAAVAVPRFRTVGSQIFQRRLGNRATDGKGSIHVLCLDPLLRPLSMRMMEQWVWGEQRRMPLKGGADSRRLSRLHYKKDLNWHWSHETEASRLLAFEEIHTILKNADKNHKPHQLKRAEARLLDQLFQPDLELAPHDLVGTWLMYARIKSPPGKHLHYFLEGKAIDLVKDFSPMQISDTFWAYAKMGVIPRHDLAVKLQEQALVWVREFEAESVVDVYYGLAEMTQHPLVTLIEHLEKQAVSLIQDFGPDHIVQTLRAYGLLGISPGKDFEKTIEARMILIRNDLDAKALVSILTSYSKIKDPSLPGKECRNALEARALSQIQAVGFEAQDLLDMIVSFGALGVRPGEQLLEAIEAQLVVHTHKLRPVQISSMLSSYARLSQLPGDLELSVLESYMDVRMDDFSISSLMDITSSLAILRIRPGDQLLRRIQAKVATDIPGFTPRDISTTFMFFAMIGLRPSPLIVAGLEAQTVALEEDFRPQDVCSVMWAYAVLGICPGQSVTVSLSRNALKFITQRMLRHLEEQKIHFFLLFLELEDKYIYRNSAAVGALRTALGPAGKDSLSDLHFLSPSADMQEEVYSVIKGLGYECEQNYIDSKSGCPIDILIHSAIAKTTKAPKIAVEIDSPWHFFSNSDHQPTGPTLFKKRLLNQLGYKVLSVPYWEWKSLDTVSGTRQTKQRGKIDYIIDLLEDVFPKDWVSFLDETYVETIFTGTDDQESSAENSVS